VDEVAERVDALLAEADALIRVRRPQAAAERAQQAAALAPEDPRPFWAWSRALYGDGQLADAAAKADQAIMLAPEDSMGFRLRSTALATLARQSSKSQRVRLGHEAVLAAREAVRLAPPDPNAHIALAQALPLIGAAKEAESEIHAVIGMAPQSAATWVAASLVAMGSRNWTAAVSASRQALAIEPDNYAALNNLGVALRHSGQRREGTEVLARAAGVEPDRTTARRNLSRAGVNVARGVVLVILIPLGFLAHVGLLLYLVCAVGSNILISRYPMAVLRMERWAVPVALFSSRRGRGRRRAGGTGEPDEDRS